jgi:hypothetical protein
MRIWVKEMADFAYKIILSYSYRVLYYAVKSYNTELTALLPL